MVLKRAVILKNYYMPNGLTSLIHKINLQNFQGCWGKVKKLSEKKFVKKFQRATEQIGKRLLPGPGETDCSVTAHRLSVSVSCKFHCYLTAIGTGPPAKMQPERLTQQTRDVEPMLFNVEPPSSTLAQHLKNNSSTSRACRGSSRPALKAQLQRAIIGRPIVV